MALTQVASGLIASVSGASLTGTQNIPKATLPTGSVLQVVNATYTTNVTTSSTSMIATGLTANITPLSSSNKILVLCSMVGCGGNASNNNPHFEIYRNGSSVSYFDDILGYGTSSLNVATSITWLDSPASTSALTYTIYWKRVGGGGGVAFINNYITAANQTVSTLTLMEIAA
jgi:hypothetical protein